MTTVAGGWMTLALTISLSMSTEWLSRSISRCCRSISRCCCASSLRSRSTSDVSAGAVGTNSCSGRSA